MTVVVGAPAGGINVGFQQALPDASGGLVHVGGASGTMVVEADVADPQLQNVLPRVAARLQERHPAASPALVQSSIEDAMRAFSTVRVRNFLPILIERMAAEALRTAARSQEGAVDVSSEP